MRFDIKCVHCVWQQKRERTVGKPKPGGKGV